MNAAETNDKKENIPLQRDSWDLVKNELNGKVDISKMSFETHSVDFSRLKQVSEIIVPRNEKDLGDYAYAFCPVLKKLIITSEVESIGEHPMHYTPNLQTIDVEEGNVNFSSENGMLYSKDKSRLIRCPEGMSGVVTISSKTTEIDRFAFSGCHNITSIELPSGIDHIGEGAFQLCENLKSIHLPNNVFHIRKNTFYNCTNLEDISLPDNLKDIAEDAFFCCKNLKTITIPKHLENISNAFDECDNLEEFKCEDDTEHFACEGKVLYSKDKKNLLLAPKAIEYLKIAEGTETIVQYALSCCDKLKKVVFPSSLTTIENHSFLKNSSLEEIILSENISNIQNNAFNSCVGVRTIISNNTTPPKISTNTFAFMPFDGITLKVPQEALEAYKKDSMWSIFKNITSL